MHRSIQLVLGAITSYLLFKILSYLNTERRHRARARELGCVNSWDLPSIQGRRDFLGITKVQEALKADRECRLPILGKARVDGLSRKHGREVGASTLTVFGQTFIGTTEPENVKTILATKFKDYSLGELRRELFEPLFGDGIFVSNGKKWEHSRALLRPQFVREQVSQLDLEEVHVSNLMKTIRVNPDGWTDVIDLQPLFFRLTLDSATEFLFGQSVESQLAELPGYSPPKNVPAIDHKTFAYFFDKSQADMARMARFGPLHWLMLSKETKYMYKQCHAFIDHFVHLALSKPQNLEKSSEKDTGSSGSSKKYVFLDALVESTRDPLELRHELLNILLAGRDTTASLLSFIFMLLIQHPAVFSKLRTIIIETFGTYSHPRNLSFSDLKGCSYLQWTINETLRLYPVVPFNDRTAITDTVLPTGGGPDGKSPIYVRKGQVVEYSVYAMHRRTDLWGKDANEFRPERWDGRRSGWEFLPFNGGPRICIGQQFALTEAAYVVVRLLQRFEGVEGVGNSWEEGPGGVGFVRQAATLTTCPADGVRARLREARE